MTLENLEKEVAQLPEGERVTLAHRILMSVEPPANTQISGAWDDEIRKRIERYDRGEATVIAANEVFAEADARLEK